MFAISLARPIYMSALIYLILFFAHSTHAAVDAVSDAHVHAGQTVISIELTGHRITRDAVIHRELRTRVGDPLDLDILHADIQRLENLDIFSSVRVQFVDEPLGLRLIYTVREIPFAIPYFSSNVTDEDGWSFGPAIKSVNMMGRDIYVAGYALFGGKTTFLLDLDYPWITGNHVSFHLDLSRIERVNELDDFDESSFELSPSWGIYLREKGRARAGFSYYRFKGEQGGHTLTSDNRDHLIQVQFGLGYDSRDRWSDPRSGWLNEIEVRRTGGPLQGDGDFWTGHLDIRRFQPVRHGHTLVAATLFSLQSGQVGIDLPKYMDYHLGGSNTIRGYDVRNLGRTLYGKNQLLNTLEYRLLLIPRREYKVFGMTTNLGLSAALFNDSGIAWSASSQLKRKHLRVGWGIGLRLLAPAVDMMRLDVGFDTEGRWRIHIASFSKMRAQRLRLR